MQKKLLILMFSSLAIRGAYLAAVSFYKSENEATQHSLTITLRSCKEIISNSELILKYNKFEDICPSRNCSLMQVMESVYKRSMVGNNRVKLEKSKDGQEVSSLMGCENNSLFTWEYKVDGQLVDLRPSEYRILGNESIEWVFTNNNSRHSVGRNR